MTDEEAQMYVNEWGHRLLNAHIVGPLSKEAIEMADSASLAALVASHPENAPGLSDDEKTWRKAMKIHYTKKAKEKKDKEKKK